MDTIIKVHDKEFRLYLSAQDIAARVKELGAQIAADYAGKTPLILTVLNGAYIFSADLIRACDMKLETSFVRLSSYEGMASTGKVNAVLGLKKEVKGRDLIIVEDIVDTGKTLHHFIPLLQQQQPASIRVATLLDKAEARTHDISIAYCGFRIPDKFVVGYGLDYDELGRNLPAIYQLNHE
jgi:hypoxanthine phosphoribosyltransferase